MNKYADALKQFVMDCKWCDNRAKVTKVGDKAHRLTCKKESSHKFVVGTECLKQSGVKL